jgi:predicted RND superfamily exporter protein
MNKGTYMKNTLLGLNDYFGSVPDALRPHRWKVISAAFLLTAFFFTGIMTRFEMDVTMDAFFSDDDPVTQALDEFREQFGSDDGLFIVYEAKDGNIFSEQSLTLIRELTEQFDDVSDLIEADEANASLDHIRRVQSLTNVQIQKNEGDTLRSEKLVPSVIPSNASELEAIAALADEQDSFRLFMFSPNHRFGAINIQTDFGAIPITDEGSLPDFNLDSEAGDDFNDDLFAEDEFDLAFDDFEVEVDETAVVQEVEFESTESTAYISFMAAVKGVYSQDQYSENFNFYPVGNSAMVDLAMDTMIEAGYLMLGMIAIVILLLWTLLHSGSAVVWSILAIVVSLVWVIGGTLWMGIAVSQMVSLTVMLVLAVGIADCVHVMSTYLFYRREGEPHERAMSHAYGKVGLPILLTTITTMAGMLALTSTGMPMFVLFGITSAAGVFMAFVFTVYLLPVLLDVWHPLTVKEKPNRTPWYAWPFKIIGFPFKLLAQGFKWVSLKIGLTWILSAAWLQPLLDKIPAFVQRAPKTIAVIFVALFGFFVAGTFQVRIDTNLVEIYREGTTFRESYKIVDEEMMGTGSMTVMLDMKQSDAFIDPNVLKASEELQELIEEKYSQYVLRTNSLADLVKTTNKIMNDGTDRYDYIPDDELAVSQLLYLFNSANPEDRRAIVSDDYAKSHITVNLRNAGSYEYSQFFEEINTDIERIFDPLRADYPDMNVTVTGTMAMMMSLMDQISTSQFKSLGLAMLIISALLMITLGSVQAGVLGIIPNLIPAIFTFGIMGWLGIPLDTDTLLIAPVIIGIAVDDTIHFITHYRMALAKTHDMKESLVSAIKEVGQAVTFTTMILGFGFFMLSFSDYLGIAKVGIFGSLAVFVALLCDLLFLPALIMIFKPKFGQTDVKEDLEFQGAPSK